MATPTKNIENTQSVDATAALSTETSVTDQEHHQTAAHSEAHAIVLAPEVLIQAGPLPITNTLIMSWVAMAILVIFGYLAGRHLKAIPTGLQNFVESFLEPAYNLVHDLAQEKTKIFFPIVMTFFLFIILSNWMGLLPGFGTIGFNRVEDGHTVFVPIFRAMSSDLNMTLGLALISAGLTHFFAVKYLGFGGYLKKWFSLNPILLFVGILEIVSEFTKVFSLSFRLFGNIFAGEEVLKTISGLFAFIAPLPFLGLEIIVGFVQAAVFMMLTLVFMVLLSDKHSTEH